MRCRAMTNNKISGWVSSSAPEVGENQFPPLLAATGKGTSFSRAPSVRYPCCRLERVLGREPAEGESFPVPVLAFVTTVWTPSGEARESTKNHGSVTSPFCHTLSAGVSFGRVLYFLTCHARAGLLSLVSPPGHTLADPEPALSGWLECGNGAKPIENNASEPHVLARPVTGWLGPLGLKNSNNGASAGVADWEARQDQRFNSP